MKTIRFYVAGVQFRPEADIKRALADGLSEGAKLNLVPEPTNKYDPGAIAVVHYGVTIGYVPKAQQADVRGTTIAVMDTVDLDAPSHKRFPIIVEAQGDEFGPKQTRTKAPEGYTLSQDEPHTLTPPPRSRPREVETVTKSAALEIVAPSYAIDGVGATAEAVRARDDLLARAGKTLGVETGDAAQAATVLLKEMTTFTRTIEDTREVVKRPILEAAKKIDATAKTLVLDVEAEAKRLGQLLGGYQAAQKKIEEENRRRAYEEQERIRRDAEERERRIREEAELKRRDLNDERNRLASEVDPTVPPADYADLTSEQFQTALGEMKAARKAREKAAAAAAKAKTAAAREKAEKAAQEAKDAEERRQREASELAERNRKDREAQEAKAEQDRWNQAALASAKVAELPTAPSTKLTGIAVGSEIKFEVTDVVALYEAAPYLVKLEPNTSSIKAALKQLSPGQTLPGVRHWKEAKTVVRQ